MVNTEALAEYMGLFLFGRYERIFRPENKEHVHETEVAKLVDFFILDIEKPN